MTLQISQRVLDLGEKARQGLAEQFARIDAIAEENTARVLSAFQKHRVAEGYFAGTTGYGYDDLGRDQLDQIYADLFGTEAALVRIQFVNGTHAITCALFGALKAGDVLLSAVGAPYDTLMGAIGTADKGHGSLRDYGVEYRQVELKDDCPDLEGLARAAAERGEPVRIYACGGDGTLNEAVAGAAGFGNAAVTHYPMGSGNDFLRMFGPDACRFYDLRALLDAPQAPVDLIECNGRLALNVCSVGFDARIGLGAADFKKLPLVSGPLAYQLSAVRTIVQGIHRPYRVTIDGERLPGEAFTLICACNGRYYGGGFNPCPDAVPDDGLLDFVVVPAVSRLTILTLIGKYAKGGAGDIPRILLRRGREMHVACERADRINLDGEELVDSELSVRVSAKKVNFFFPEGTHWIPEKRVRN